MFPDMHGGGCLVQEPRRRPGPERAQDADGERVKARRRRACKSISTAFRSQPVSSITSGSTKHSMTSRRLDYLVTATSCGAASGLHYALIEGLTVATPDGKTLIRDSRLAVHTGRRYALVGPNGAGKSMLLQAIADGAVPGWPVATLSTALVCQDQDVAVRAVSAQQSLLDARASFLDRDGLVAERQKLEAELDDSTGGSSSTSGDTSSWIERKAKRLGEIDAALEAMEASEAKREARAILVGLQFPSTDGFVSELSGGWRQRLALAQALFIRPDVLLLDEPTNHLDIAALRWLTEHLLESNATALIVSHDPHFLTLVSTDTLCLEQGGIQHTAAPYETFLSLREQRARRDQGVLAAAEAKEAKLQSMIKQQERTERAHMSATCQVLERDPHVARAVRVNADRAQSKQQAAVSKTALEKKLATPLVQSARCGWTSEKLSAADAKERVMARQAASEERACPWRFAAALPIGSHNSVRLEGVTLGRGSKAVLGALDLCVGSRARVAIIGANGVGKSTLLEALQGDAVTGPARAAGCGLTIASLPTELAEDDNDTVQTLGGVVTCAGRLRVAVVHQDHHEQLRGHLDRLSWQYVAERAACTELRARHLLGAVGLGGNHLAFRTIRELSGGERTRLVFAVEILAVQPHLLLLDEPTNHLDLDGVEALIGALHNFEGAVVCVSHHRHFIASFARELWHVRRKEGTAPDGAMACVDVRHADDAFAATQVLNELWPAPMAAKAAPTPTHVQRPSLQQLPAAPQLHARERPASMPAPPDDTPPETRTLLPTNSSVALSVPADGPGASASAPVAVNFGEESCEAAEERVVVAQKAAAQAQKKAAKASKAARRAVLNGDADADELQAEATRLMQKARRAAKVAAEAVADAAAKAAAAAAAEERIALGLSKWEALELDKWKKQAACHRPQKVWARAHVHVDESGFQTIVRGSETPAASEQAAAAGAHPKAVSPHVAQLMEVLGISEDDAVQSLCAAEGNVDRAIDSWLQTHELA